MARQGLVRMTCDRCETNRTLQDPESSGWRQIGLSGKPGGVDLCPDCYHGLEIWWEEGKPGVSEQ